MHTDGSCTCSLSLTPYGPMSGTHPQAVPFSLCMSSPVVFPSTFLSPSICCMFHLSSILHQLSLSLALSLIHFAPSGHLLSKDNMPLSTPGHSLCPLPSSKGIFRHRFMYLTECVLAFSTLVFICHLLPPTSHYSHRLLLNRDVVRNDT